MTKDNPLGDRGRSLEEEYFRKKDRELVEKIRRAAAAQEARQQLSAKSGLQDPELINELEALGFTPETVILLPFIPLIQVAWAEGGISDAERALLMKLARSRGIAEGSAADRQLTDWLATRPAEEVFARAMRLARAVLSSPAEHRAMSADDVVKYAEDIAAASGGMFGIGRVSAEERAILMTVAAELKLPRSAG
jgi:hypothetical protein